jgi:uncharacterized protein (DUF4415 family)
MMKHYHLDPKNPRRLTEAEQRLLDETPIDYCDIPELSDDFFKRATRGWPPVKKQLTIRLDEDVLDWVKRHGKGYQTRINRILRVVMESQPPAPPSKLRSALQSKQRPAARPKPRSTAVPAAKRRSVS